MAGKKSIPMRVVKERTGLTARQIRYYDEVGLIFPERTKGNQRLFSEDDINRMKKIKSLLDEGYKIEAIKEVLNHPRPIKGNLSNLRTNLNNRINKGDLSRIYPGLNRNLKERYKKTKE